ncbi:SIMPL domain-containing protein [Alloalcanivorax xenomutans]|uniref:SIMPL domain-containing protein n=1 Tax=Alloalcanivorax xenomutans TaxID=1094342 RepID=A0A9Q3W287_9GAMM|nr:SIMPL domain-containing protein [Alloalcanivorax xenomutans]ARB46305.1 enolase [Alloalcanivorax xenomutans]MCE7507888.1 SIMPL domain-containing protein [Alloalcanivorax xenomutans]WOD26925.1 SIMPL domain-containing protein [Alloalcanivorax xenomutans]
MRNKPALFVVALAVLGLSACGTDSGTATGERDTITVSGEGNVSGQPDIFNLQATARETGDDIATMKGRVDDQVKAMLDLADSLDIEEKDVTATDIRVTPQWQYQPERKLIGHEVAREVRFQVKGIEVYAELADGLTKLGLKDISPAGTDISNAAELNQQALEAAVEDARAKAEIVAKAADRKLGPAITINVQSQSHPVPMMRAAMAKDAVQESYRPGEQDLSAQVMVTFQLR